MNLTWVRTTRTVDGMKQYLLASDFDQTLSFNDSGHVLSEILGVGSFAEKVAGLARINLVQQGGELAYLILHDPELRQVRREHLQEAGRRIRLKRNIPLLCQSNRPTTADPITKIPTITDVATAGSTAM